MEIINPIQKEILGSFGEIPDSEQFCLTGGTALALFHLHHRKSKDLDFFTDQQELILPFSHEFEKRLKEKGIKVDRQRSFATFVEFTAKKGDNSTVIQFAQDSPFHLEPPEMAPDFKNLKIYSLADIASGKLLALFNRASLRDFVDVYTLVRKNLFSTERLLEMAKKKDPGFDLYWLGVALEWIKTFKEDSPEMLMLIEPIDFKDMAQFFDHWREELAEKLKP